MQHMLGSRRKANETRQNSKSENIARSLIWRQKCKMEHFQLKHEQFLNY